MKFQIPGGIPRAALITGGPQPANVGIAQALTEHGFRIGVSGDTEGFPAGTASVPADLSDERQTQTWIARATAVLGPIGVLVNAAGGPDHDSASRQTWDEQIDRNIRVPFLLIEQFARSLPSPHEGVAINLLGQGVWSLSPHALSKAALWRLTQSMALAHAPRIRVNGIGSGPVLGTETGSGRADPRQIGRAALAILALRSMTGQMIVPDGVPPSKARA